MTITSHPLKIAEIALAVGGGRIGITFAPGKKQPSGLTGPHDRDLGVDLDLVAAWNAAAVLTLCEQHELDSLQIGRVGHEVRLRHMEWHHHPIPDISVPGAAFEDDWPALSTRLRELLLRGCRVLIHCRGGLGRAGMIAARLLVETGMEANDAVATVRAVRPGAIETNAQEAWVARGKETPLPSPATDREAVRDRAVGALVGLAVGDALGAALEFSNKPRFAALAGMVGGGPFGLKPGQWTDDTAMALALADSLAHDARLDARDLMNRFTSWYRDGAYSCTGTCFDIGNATRAALDRYAHTGDPFAGSTSPNAAGNGALMRLAPVAVRHWHRRDVMSAVADLQTCTTHGTPATLRCSRTLAELVACAIEGESLNEVLAGPVAADIEGGWKGIHRDAINGAGYVVRALQAAVWAVSRTTSFGSAVLLAANLGDDADTTAAIAGQLAGAVYGLSGIPSDWIDILAWRERIEVAAERLFESAWEEFAKDTKERRIERLTETGAGIKVSRPGVGIFSISEGELVMERAFDNAKAQDAAKVVSNISDAADDLIAFWSHLGDGRVHPDDAPYVKPSEFAVDLLPAPWAGSLRTAKTYFLFLNPGLSDRDYEEEARPAFKAALRANLAGDRPYLYLRNEHATHPGYNWARQTFGADITEAAAAAICVLQLVPYHSKEGRPALTVASKLPSSLAVRRYVHESLLPRARAGEIGLVVARSSKLWGVQTDEANVVVYSGSEPRRAFQTPNSRGGQLLRRMIGPSQIT